VSEGYRVLSLDDLERLTSTDGTLTLLPLRRTLGFRPFGVNGWLGAEPGDHVIERHREQDGDEELYVVVRGRARFTLGEETFDAPAGTLVHAPARCARRPLPRATRSSSRSAPSRARRGSRRRGRISTSRSPTARQAGSTKGARSSRTRWRSTRGRGKGRTTPRASKRSQMTTTPRSGTCTSHSSVLRR
jgi:hypothetical protein